jgi:DnaJ-domain-containing protein 1
MSEPIRFARIAQAYSTNTGVYSRPRSASISQSGDTVQISEEAQERSKAFTMKIKGDLSSDQPSAQSQTGNTLDILNLPSNATKDQIRRAYKGAIKQYHPDNFANFCSEFQKLAEEKCKQINLAYQKLSTA